MAQSIWSMASLVSVSIDPVFITVIGQCMGAGAIEQAELYFKFSSDIAKFMFGKNKYFMEDIV